MTEKATHTPGPWMVMQTRLHIIVRSVHAGGRPALADMDKLFIDGSNLGEALADAHLMAAAPEMLAALKEYVEWGAMTGSDRDLFEDKFRAAIAKAEGR